MIAAHTTLALIHGLGSSRQAWGRVAPLLLESGFRILPVELPGYGEHRSRQPERTIEGMADAAAASIEARAGGDSGAPVIVVGHSMGGLVATAIAERAPGLADRIVLVNSSLTVASRLTAHRGSEGLIHKPVVGPIAWRIAPRGKLRDGLRSAFAPGYPVPDVFVDDLRACSWATFTRSNTAMNAYLQARSLPDRLAVLGVPSRLIYGTQDLRIDAAAIDAVCAAQPGTVVRIEGAGHTPMWESPELAAEAITQAAGDVAAR